MEAVVACLAGLTGGFFFGDVYLRIRMALFRRGLRKQSQGAVPQASRLLRRGVGLRLRLGFFGALAALAALALLTMPFPLAITGTLLFTYMALLGYGRRVEEGTFAAAQQQITQESIEQLMSTAGGRARLTESFGSANPFAQQEIMKALAVQPGPDLPPLLHQGLRHSHSAIRMAAFSHMKSLYPAELGETLKVMVKDNDPAMRHLALSHLSDTEGEVRQQVLFTLLQDPEKELRTQAQLLVDKGNPLSSVTPWLEQVNPESHPALTLAALKVIADATTDPLVRQAQLHQHPGIWHHLRGPNMPIRAAVVRLLGRLGHPESVSHIDDVMTLYPDPSFQKVCLFALARIGTADAGKYIAQRLGSPLPEIARAAVEALVRMGPPAVPVLEEALQSDLSEVRLNACRAFSMLKAPEARPALEALRNDKDPRVRRMALVAMGFSASGDSLQNIIESLADSDPAVRLTALRALAQLRPLKAMPALYQLYNRLQAGNHFIAGEELRREMRDVVELIKAIYQEHLDAQEGLARAMPSVYGLGSRRRPLLLEANSGPLSKLPPVVVDKLHHDETGLITGVHTITGYIGTPPAAGHEALQPEWNDSGNYHLPLWNEAEKAVLMAEIDVLLIWGTDPELNYDWATSAVVQALLNDTTRTRPIEVRLQGEPPLSENTLRALHMLSGAAQPVAPA